MQDEISGAYRKYGIHCVAGRLHRGNGISNRQRKLSLCGSRTSASSADSEIANRAEAHGKSTDAVRFVAETFLERSARVLFAEEEVDRLGVAEFDKRDRRAWPEPTAVRGSLAIVRSRRCPAASPCARFWLAAD